MEAPAFRNPPPPTLRYIKRDFSKRVLCEPPPLLKTAVVNVTILVMKFLSQIRDLISDLSHKAHTLGLPIPPFLSCGVP